MKGVRCKLVSYGITFGTIGSREREREREFIGANIKQFHTN